MTKKDIAKKIADATGIPQMTVTEIVRMWNDSLFRYFKDHPPI